jgi:hypothetical protein
VTARRRPQVVDPEVDGGHAAANGQSHREIACGVDQGGDRSAVELRHRRIAPHVRQQRHAHLDDACRCVCRDHLHLAVGDERRCIGQGLQVREAKGIG